MIDDDWWWLGKPWFFQSCSCLLLFGAVNWLICWFKYSFCGFYIDQSMWWEIDLRGKSWWMVQMLVCLRLQRWSLAHPSSCHLAWHSFLKGIKSFTTFKVQLKSTLWFSHFTHTGWWFGTFFSHNIWDVILPIDFHIFQDGWNHQPAYQTPKSQGNSQYISFVSVPFLFGSAAGHDASLAVKLLRSMGQLRFQPDVVSYNAVAWPRSNGHGMVMSWRWVHVILSKHGDIIWRYNGGT